MPTPNFRFYLLLATAVLLAGPAWGIDPVFESGPVKVPAGPDLTASDRIDERVFARLAELNLKPANLCSDSVFLRRAYLATIGTLPTEDETRDFLASADERKRAVVIEHLLQRPEFADFWAMKWGDILRVKAEFPIKLWPNAVQAYHHWIHDSIRENKPFHQFSHEILVANGSNFREGQVNFFRAMQDRSPRGIASTVALTFMGERADQWPEKKLDALAGFFSQVAFKPTAEWKEEIVYFDPTADEEGLAKGAMFPDGTPVTLEPGKYDPRLVFADWLLRPENPWFSRNITNRVWSWLMGRGIVHEPDDFRPDNPPSNPALLEFLQEEFVRSRCDMRNLFRVILNSQTFQLSSIPAQDSPEAVANFAHYPLRRLEAEVLIDALNQITQTKEDYSSPIPEPFTFIPDDVRGIALADGSITSSFLELFGRPPRDTGFESERSRNTSSAQSLHLLNSSHIINKVKACPLVTGASNSSDDHGELVERAYLTLLSRMPTEAERKTIEAHAQETTVHARELAADLVWALINQPEFYFNH
ncbi:MAG: DUF1553 domain-containing protein [Verrucomicrobiae bacterium]|nr:DUF1553 domain-containing protein [Verrucomicrobiae bacterium]